MNTISFFGRLFQSFGAKKENDLPPAVDFDILGIIKRPPVLSASGHLSVRDQNKRRNLADHQRATALVWTLRPRPPLPPPSLLGKGSK